eukprot:PLAT13289.1.p1 GENE.PLAT13289.1~~PLAT13289.1.p1  ORF type:complete len:126 (-),score=19.62 PLAT13289.1:425-775(-)
MNDISTFVYSLSMIEVIRLQSPRQPAFQRPPCSAMSRNYLLLFMMLAALLLPASADTREATLSSSPCSGNATADGDNVLCLNDADSGAGAMTSIVPTSWLITLVAGYLLGVMMVNY